jgi:hypothetical protein
VRRQASGFGGAAPPAENAHLDLEHGDIDEETRAVAASNGRQERPDALSSDVIIDIEEHDAIFKKSPNSLLQRRLCRPCGPSEFLWKNTLEREFDGGLDPMN